MLGLYPTGERIFGCKHLLRLLFSVIIFQFECVGVFSSLFFIATHIENDVKRAINCTLQIAALSSAAYIMMLGFILRSKIIKIFGAFEKINEDSKYGRCHLDL